MPSYSGARAPIPASVASYGPAFGIRFSGGGVVPPILPVIYALTSSGLAGFTGMAVPTSYARQTKPTLTIIAPPIGLTDNNDGSFTNETEGGISISGRIILQGYSVSSLRQIAMAAGTDNSGVDVPILFSMPFTTILGVGMNRPNTNNSQPFTWAAEYMVVLQAGKTVFPMLQCNSGATTMQSTTLSHSVWSKA